MGLYVTLPSTFLPLVRYSVVGIGLVLLIPLVVLNPVRFRRETTWSRRLSVTQTVLLLVANLVALVQLIDQLVNPGTLAGQHLLLSAVQVWVTNVIAFALVYWEIDRGGPVSRSQTGEPGARRTDLRFPQDDSPAVPGWRPDFLDYLVTSLWTSTAFSPTEAMPMSHRAKIVMALESVAGIVLFALVIGRSVNIFS